MISNKNSRKKAQVALEFLTTYSWVMLIVLITFATLYKFDVFNFDFMVREECFFGQNIGDCDEFIVDLDEDSGQKVKVLLTNPFPYEIILKNCNINIENICEFENRITTCTIIEDESHTLDGSNTFTWNPYTQIELNFGCEDLQATKLVHATMNFNFSLKDSSRVYSLEGILNTKKIFGSQK